MYSRCPHCQTQQTISAEQLRISRGLLTCSACGKRFDALASLSERADAEFQEVSDADLLSNPHGKRAHRAVWRIGALLSLLLLLAQVAYFKGDAISRQPLLRFGWQAICDHLGCRLPMYKNLDEWTVSHSDLRSLSDQNYVFSAAITNQAAFPQNCPDLKLVLLNLSGQAIAERIFSGRQYSTATSLAANETAEIKLTVVAPPGPAKIGGYTLALL
jgi:predicted Zn finger-like uncharacterized protein